jgi:hypothetical protein
MPLDLTLIPLYRLNGEDQASLPGLMASVAPRKSARGRDQDRLVVYLLLAGNAVLSTGEYVQLSSRAAVAFFETPGTLTAALRVAAESINKLLYERNMSSPGHGLYALGVLTLAAIRESQATLLMSGPMHAFVLSVNGAQDISDTLSGKGLGLSQSAPYYFSQVSLQPNDRLVLCSKVPFAWESALKDTRPDSLESTRRRFMTLITEDVNAVLMAATEGTGALTVLRPVMEDKTPATPPAPSTEQASAPPAPAYTDIIQRAAQAREAAPEAPQPDFEKPSAYAIPPEAKEELPLPEEAPSPTPIFDSLPRARSTESSTPVEEPAASAPEKREARRPSARTRRTARTLANGMQTLRRGNEWLSESLQNFLPRLLPGSSGRDRQAAPSTAEQSSSSLGSPVMMFIALLVPLIVVTIASMVYFRYGRSVEYEEYLVQAQNARAQAVGLTDPAAQREAWQHELFYLDKAEASNQTDETRSLRQEAQSGLDQLQGITRLQFQPVLSNGVGSPVGRLAASENDLYLLDAQRGGIMHIALTTSGFQRDSAFDCLPGSYGDYTVGPLVDIRTLLTVNTFNATVIGVDAAGTLLYCAPGQVAQAVPLPPPDTNWGRVKAIALDNGNLYVLDARSRAVWVYVGKDGSFVDRPYFFFGGQIPELADAIDLAVNNDDLYILHSDGHLSTCSYSRIAAVPTRCVDPAPLVNPLPAYKDTDLFSTAHFTQMMFTPAPDSTLLLLDSDSQGVFRFTPRTLELQSQLRPLAGRDNQLPQGIVGAMTVSPNHILYFAIQDKLYFATDSP